MKPPESRVLIVADAGQCELLVQVVARVGSSSVTASRGAEALALLERESFELMLIDSIADISPVEVLARLGARGRPATMPVLMLTAPGDAQGRTRALEAGALDVLVKPVDTFELGCKVRALVELAQLRTQQLDRVAEEAAAALLSRIQAVAKGLPLLMYEFEVRGPAEYRGSWMIGDLARLAGIDSERFSKGERWEELMHPDDREQAFGALRPFLSGEATSQENEFRLRSPEGGYRWFSNVSRFDPEHQRQSGIMLDITKQKEMEGQLAQSQKMDAVAILAGGIAHDFNNILAVILSFAGFASEGLSPTDRRYADLNEVVKAANRAARLTRQLLTVTSQQPMDLEPTDLNRRLGELSSLIAAAAGPEVRVTVAPGVFPAVVEIDPAQFDQVVLNLVANAREAMPEGGTLHIQIDSDSDRPELETRHVRLVVTDSGVGMDDTTQQRIFEPFFTTKEKSKGSGLGLATCFGIIEAAGGSIRVSSSMGHGAIFTVELPLSDRAPAKAERSAPAEPVGRGENILLVEDEGTLLRALVRVFEGAGYQVHSAPDGLAAKRLIDQLGASLDAVVTDVIMPDVGGDEVARHAAAVAPDAVVFLTSGYLDGARNDGAFPILWKPIPPREIARTVAGALSARRSNRKHERLNGSAPPAPEVVLIVEDDPAAQQALSRLLSGGGFAPQVVGSLREARQALETQPEPDILLCDLSLPDGSGTELLSWIQATRPTLRERVFVLTGSASAQSSRQLIADGSFPVLSKLTPPAQLLEILSRARRNSVPARASSQAPAPSVREPQGPRSAPRERVLIVDEDVALSKASTRMLQAAGFDVASATTLAEGARWLAAQEFSALVLDASLLESCPADLHDELRNPKLASVVLTASPNFAPAAKAAQRHATEYLMKPFSADALRAATRGVIDAERAARIRRQLLAAHHGGDDFQADLQRTEASFSRALARLGVAFQPIVRDEDGSVFGFEALLRCADADFASPARLLAAAQVLGRQHDLGHRVRTAVASTLLEHPERSEVIFVNVDPAELTDGLLFDPADPLLPFARRVVLEISERASLFGADSGLERRLSRLREHGYRLALDDLGEGYAGLSSLTTIRPDIVKLDTSLVRDIHRSALKRDIVVSLLDAARRAGIIVVAEGVESVDERAVLSKLGCDLMQGYLFAKPGPAFPVPSRPG